MARKARGRYDTWREFKGVLEERLERKLTKAMWETLEEQLYWSAIHEPFSDGDIDMAIKIARKLRARWGK